MAQRGSVCGEKIVAYDKSVWYTMWFAWDENEMLEFQTEHIDNVIKVLQALKESIAIPWQESYQDSRET